MQNKSQACASLGGKWWGAKPIRDFPDLILINSFVQQNKPPIPRMRSCILHIHGADRQAARLALPLNLSIPAAPGIVTPILPNRSTRVSASRIKLVTLMAVSAMSGIASAAVIVPSADSYVATDEPNENFGRSTSLYAATGEFFGNHSDARIYLKFNLVTIPLGTDLTEATLSTYAPVQTTSPGQNITMGIHLATDRPTPQDRNVARCPHRQHPPGQPEKLLPATCQPDPPTETRRPVSRRRWQGL